MIVGKDVAGLNSVKAGRYKEVLPSGPSTEDKRLNSLEFCTAL